jgi:condensin complex subunit 1
MGSSHPRELANKEFNSNDTKGPKSVSTFIIRLSELAPRLVIKQMTLLAKQLDSEVPFFFIRKGPLNCNH